MAERGNEKIAVRQDFSPNPSLLINHPLHITIGERTVICVLISDT